MRSFMLGAGFACGLLLTGLGIARWAFHQNYVPMKDRSLEEDEYGEWLVVPGWTITTTFN